MDGGRGLRRVVGLVWGVMGVWRVAAGHVCRVRAVEEDLGIMALVDMVCVHDMDVTCIARGVAN